MNKIEILAPAGDMESLKAAIANGADAIYLGPDLFSARAFAKNFSLPEIKEAVEYAHLRNVRIFITVNILYHDDEFKKLFQYIDHFYEYQVDALLIQDIGLLKAVRKRYPDFEVHVSTQMTVNSLEAVRYFEDLGVTRIVLSRENTIEEIRYIKEHSSLEIEVFAHGALCVSYSGQCLMSSMIGKRSGNRGACAQPCRMTYQLKEDGQVIENEAFLLSPRDLCTIDNLQEYIDANVTSLKLEGRMKKPEYVAAITKAYRKAVDHCYGKKENYTKDDIDDMKQMFNRHYTKGFPFHDPHIVDTDFSGNRGMPLGVVIGYNRKRKVAAIKLTDELKQGDSILFKSVDAGRPVNKIYFKGKLVNTGHPGETVEIEFDQPVFNGDVMKTVSVDTLKKLDETFMHEKKYRSISFILHAHKDAFLSLEALSGEEHVTIASEHLIEEARHTPTDASRIKKQLSKLGSTIYLLDEISLDMDENINIPISLLNNLRRDAVDTLNDRFAHTKLHHLQPQELPQPKQHTSHKNNYIVVRTIEQLQTVMTEDNVYMYYDEETVHDAFDIFVKHHKPVCFYMPRINTDEDIQNILNNPIIDQVESFIVNDYGLYRLWKDKHVILGSGLNITNSLSASSFNESIIASYETSRQELEKMSQVTNELIVQIYGKTENMITEHCLVSQHYFQKKIKHCHRCKGHTYTLVDRKGYEFTLFTDERCRNHILHNVPILIESYGSLAISTLLFFLDEDCQTIHEVLEAYKTNSFHEYRNQIASTSGYYKV